jgi:hypothetical protein
MLGVDVEVREPPELIAQMRALARRIQRAAGAGPDALVRDPRRPTGAT